MNKIEIHRLRAPESVIYRRGGKHWRSPKPRFVVTEESNFFLLWIGRCRDTKPWEESEWDWNAIEVFKDREDAIESCVLRSVAEPDGSESAAEVPA